MMKDFLVNLDTQSIQDTANDKVIYFSFDDFMERFVRGNNCFICGASPGEKSFNDEHIIPDWILRRFKLHDEEITLPNETTMQYGKYKIRCCAACNSFLGEVLETPISKYLNEPYAKLVKKIEEDPLIVDHLFIWMCLIYIKTHLKNTTLLLERDKRLDAGKIGDRFDWHHIHHVHCMARVYYTDAKVHEKVYGSMLILPALPAGDNEPFDYMDSVGAQCAMIRVGETCILAVLNDSKAGQILLDNWLKKISGPLTIFQLKELFAHLVFINLHLKERPVYYSGIGEQGYQIGVTLPEKLELADKAEQIVTAGELLHNYVSPLIPDDNPDRVAILQTIKEGKRSYFFNEKGEFVDYSRIPEGRYDVE
ncbi:MAG: hypothetical protein ACHQ1H_12955 [Nitrososphaerales archaeon]